jgi:hypothetical protein
VVRAFTRLHGSPPRAGERVGIYGFAFPSNPRTAYGLAYQEVGYASELGPTPAWYIRGRRPTWVLFVHGYNAPQQEALRLLAPVAKAGFPAMVLSYRNDPGAPASADHLRRWGACEWRDLQLVKLGCETKETTSSMIAGGRCSYDHGSQLAEAEAFLKPTAGPPCWLPSTSAPTTSAACISRATGAIDLACVQSTFQQAPAKRATILARMRTAAGPRVPIAGTSFYDPFLAAWLQGPAGQSLARLSVQLVTQYNDLLEAAYQGAGVPVADVEGGAFSTPTSTTW